MRDIERGDVEEKKILDVMIYNRGKKKKKRRKKMRFERKDI